MSGSVAPSGFLFFSLRGGGIVFEQIIDPPTYIITDAAHACLFGCRQLLFSDFLLQDVFNPFLYFIEQNIIDHGICPFV